MELIQRYFPVGDCYEHVHQSFFQGSFEINKTDSLGRTLLHHGCVYGKWQAVEELVKMEGVNLDLQDRDGCTPLHLACIHGHVKCVQQLVEHPAELSLQDHKGYTPLHHATEQGNFECAQLLLQCPLDDSTTMLSMKCNNDLTPLELHDKHGKGLLHHAYQSGDAVTVLDLLEAGADPNKQDANGFTPLYYAASQFLTNNITTWCSKVTVIHKIKDGQFPLIVQDNHGKTIVYITSVSVALLLIQLLLRPYFIMLMLLHKT
jgi:ankyrin repeat protein